MSAWSGGAPGVGVLLSGPGASVPQGTPYSGYAGGYSPWSTGGGTALPNGNPLDQRDVYNQTQQIGQNAYTQGQNLQSQFAGQGQYFANQLGNYDQTAQSLFNPIWQGGGGYNAQQLANVVQNPQGLQSQVSQQNQNLTDLANNGYTQQQNTVGAGGAAMQATVGQTAQGLGAAQQFGLGQYGQAGQQLGQAVGATAQGLNYAMGNPNLNVTPQYLQQAGMSNAEVQAAGNQAAQQIGSQYRATEDQVLQSALASGQGTPGQLAASLGALQNQAAPQVQEATTNALLAARQQQMAAAQGIQSTQLQAGQYQAGLGSQNALALGGLDSQDALAYGQQGLTQEGLQSQNALAGGQQALGAEQSFVSSDLAAQQYGQSQQMNAAQQNIANSMGLQGQLSGEYQAAYQPWVQAQQAGYGAALGLDQQAQSGALNSGQQQLGAYGSTYGNTLGASNAYSGYGNSAQGEGFGGLLENSFANSLGNGFGIGGGFGSGLGSSLGRSVTSGGGTSGGGTSGGGTSGASYTGGVYPPYAEGGVVSKPQIIQVGENSRPEAILPLDPATPPSERNIWEKMGSNLGDALGIKTQAAQTERVRSPFVQHFDTGGVVGMTNPGGTGAGANVPAGFYTGLATGISSGGVDTGSGQAASAFNGGSMGVSSQQIQDQNASVAANQNAAMASGFGNYGAGGGHQVTQADLSPGGAFWTPGAAPQYSAAPAASAPAAQSTPAYSMPATPAAPQAPFMMQYSDPQAPAASPIASPAGSPQYADSQNPTVLPQPVPLSTGLEQSMATPNYYPAQQPTAYARGGLVGLPHIPGVKKPHMGGGYHMNLKRPMATVPHVAKHLFSLESGIRQPGMRSDAFKVPGMSMADAPSYA